MKAMTHYANPQYEQAVASAPLSVAANASECTLIFNPTGTAKFLSSCDILKSALAREGVNYANTAGPAGALAQFVVGDKKIDSFDGHGLSAEELKTKTAALTTQIRAAVVAAGYPAKADMSQFNGFMVWLIIFYVAVLFAAAQSPVAATLVELFPASVRYTAVSVPYHLSSIIAGFLVPISFAMAAAAGDIYFGLWYPVIWTILGAVVYFFALPETRGQKIQDWF
jgi:hypothetical protein